MKLRGRRINAQKAATLSIVMNSIEVALLIGLLVRRPFMGLNHFMEEKLEETELL